MAGSAATVAAIGAGEPLHADFGSGTYEGRPISIPYDVVGRRTPRSRVSFDYAGESDRVGYPIPPAALRRLTGADFEVVDTSSLRR